MGPELAIKFRAVLEDLAIADSMSDFGISPDLVTDADGSFTLPITSDFSIQIAPSHLKLPMDANGSVNWDEVRRIRILRIGQNND